MNASIPPAILDLPDALVVKCLALVPMRQRLEAVSLVCKRFRRLCLAPELLRTAQLGAEGEAALARCHSLQHFLAQHARHVRSLTLHLKLSSRSEGAAAPAEPEQQAQLGAAVAGCLAACIAATPSSSSTGLQELVLSAATPVAYVEHWLPHLTCLRVLWLGQETETLRLPADMSSLTALRELGLRGRAVSCAGNLCLPASLTRLHVTGRLGDEVLRSQLPGLPALQALETARCGLSSEAALAAIGALPSLRCLQLDVHHTLLVGWLSALTQLQQLSLHGQLLAEGGEGEDGGGADLEALVLESASQLEAALAPLHQLMCLMLHVVPMAHVPQALAGLPLQRLVVDTVIWPGPPGGLPWPCPALESLRWLGLNWQVARNSLPALAAAPQLEYICLTTFPDCLHVPGEAALWQQWWDWAATHPPLRCLALEPEPSDPNMLHKHISSLVALARRRPALSIRSTLLPADDLCWCRSSESDTTSFFFFAEELLTLTDIPA